MIWAALLASGVDPVVSGLAIGLSAPAYSPTRGDLDQATGLVREFREQPTPELARSATASLTSTLSPNARLQNFYHPWTSYVIVPVFALANAGIVVNAHFLAHAYTTPITVGILLGYLVGKPVAVVGTSWALTVFSKGRIRAAGGLGGRARQRDHRRRRVHRDPADRDLDLSRSRTRRGQTRRPVGRGGRIRDHLGGLPGRRDAVTAAAGAGDPGRRRADPGPRPTGRPGA